MQLLNEFIFPLLVTIALHIGLVFTLTLEWPEQESPDKVHRPKIMQAKLVQLEANKKNTEDNKKKTKVVDLTKKKQEAERKKKLADAKRKKQLKQKKEAQAKKKREQKAKEEAKRKAEQERQKIKQQEALRQAQETQAFEEALAQEELALLEESYAMTAQSHMAAIAQRIEQKWSRPLSARKGMECELKIKLVPTGRVIDVAVVKSSGNSHFDRSAVQAVKQVEIFPEIQQMESEVFERYYRELKLLFRPEDLRL